MNKVQEAKILWEHLKDYYNHTIDKINKLIDDEYEVVSYLKSDVASGTKFTSSDFNLRIKYNDLFSSLSLDWIIDFKQNQNEVKCHTIDVDGVKRNVFVRCEGFPNMHLSFYDVGENILGWSTDEELVLFSKDKVKIFDCEPYIAAVEANKYTLIEYFRKANISSDIESEESVLFCSCADGPFDINRKIEFGGNLFKETSDKTGYNTSFTYRVGGIGNLDICNVGFYPSIETANEACEKRKKELLEEFNTCKVHEETEEGKYLIQKYKELGYGKQSGPMAFLKTTNGK